MQQGKVLIAEDQGLFVLKFVGDVRLTLCCSMESYFEKILGKQGFCGLVVDLNETDGIDSTSLGLLGKLAIKIKQLYNVQPTIFSQDADINRLLESMYFHKIFTICDGCADETATDLCQMPEEACDEQTARNIIIDAHKMLMDLDENNRAKFSDLVQSLEAAS